MADVAARPVDEAPLAAFVISLIGGLIILAGSAMMTFFGAPYYGMMGGYYGNYGMMGGFGYAGWFYWAAAIGLLSGVVVSVGAAMVYARPRSAQSWGILVLVFSVVSFFGMGGFFLGSILGIVGGILALTWRPSPGGTTRRA